MKYGVRDEIGAPLRKRLELGEVITSLRTRYYAIEESVKSLDSLEAGKVMDWWLGRLNEVLGSLGEDGLEAFKASVGLSVSREGLHAGSDCEVDHDNSNSADSGEDYDGGSGSEA